MATDNRSGIYYRAPALVASFTALMLRNAATILLTVVWRLFAAAVIIVIAFVIVAIAFMLGERRTVSAGAHRDEPLTE
jgi:hypothetical protein